VSGVGYLIGRENCLLAKINALLKSWNSLFGCVGNLPAEPLNLLAHRRFRGASTGHIETDSLYFPS